MVWLLTAMALANPAPVTWQGRLLDSTGAPINGDQATVLRIFDVSANGTALHTETELLSFSDGYAATLVGDSQNNPLSDSWLDGRPLFLEVEVGGVVLGPRQRLGGALAAAGASASEGLRSVYESTADATADGLLAYVDFDNPNGCEDSPISDRMGYLSSTCRGTGARVPGVVGMGIDRGTGVQHGVVIDFPNNDVYTTFTASLWFRPTSTPCHNASTDCAGILWLSSASAQNMVGFLSSVVSNGLTWGQFPNASGVSSGTTRATDLQWTPGEWHHIVVTMNASTGQSWLYLNGQVLDSRTDYDFQLGPRASVANYHTLSGGNSNAHYARGVGDEFAIWNRVLSYDEVVALHTAQRSGRPLAPPVPGSLDTAVLFSGSDGTPIGDIGQDVADHNTFGGNIAVAFDGNIDQSHAVGPRKNQSGPSYIGKDWGAGVQRVVTRFQAYGSNTLGFSNSSGIPEAAVRVHLEGSNDNFATVATLHTSMYQIDVASGSAPPFDEMVPGNPVTDAYRYHRLRFDPIVFGDGSAYPGNCCNIAEVRFFGAEVP